MNIPISIIFMTSTKGHFGCKTLYIDTLNHFAKQIPLSSFSVKIAHIKVSEGDDLVFESMKNDLEIRGFKVIHTVSNWVRGQSHQNEYMRDLIRLSKEKELYKNQHVLWMEDDSTMTCHKTHLDECLGEMVKLVEESPDTLSARFLRASDLASSPIIKMEKDYFWSPHFNFQPSIMRTRDFRFVCICMERNFDQFLNIQCEALWAGLLAPLSHSQHKHIVWHPDYAETIHLGVSNFEEVRKTI